MARTARPAGNLPAETTSFIGRRHQLAEIRSKLSAARLVSLVGPGGVGKTRLAIRIATDLARGFRDGAWLVELAEVRDPGLVGNATVVALDLRDQSATEPQALLLSYLRDKELLLVFDNCEHLLGAAAQLLAEVLRAAPAVRAIATSREPLSAPGEHVVGIPPLALPPQNGLEPLARLRQNEAVMLFTERAAASARFELTAANQAAVTGLCRRLDGLPLAIELAAVRTRVLSPDQILDRLADRFGLLTGGGRAALPRQQTLRTTIDWSYDLLSGGEQTLLRRLCVFASRFTLEDVESACTSEEVPRTEALDFLISLVDKSLVMREDAGRLACYRLHETMREYAQLRLGEAGEMDLFERRLADHYSSRCRASSESARFTLISWLEWMDLEIDNIRAILGRCLIDGDLALGVELACDLSWYWITRATTEGARWLDQLLKPESGSRELQARAGFLRGFLAVLQFDPAAARPPLERAVAAARDARHEVWLSHSLSMASIAARMAGDHPSAGSLLKEAESVTSELDDLAPRLTLLQARALSGFFTANLELVRTSSSEGVRLSREANDLYTLEIWLMNLGLVELSTGDLAQAGGLLEEALRIARQIDDRAAQSGLVGALGFRAAASGEPRLAAQLLGASAHIQAQVGGSANAVVSVLSTQAQESATGALGAKRFAAEFERGSHHSREVAIALALGQPADAAVETDRDGQSSPLAKREAEVAGLVAEGLSNKEIGARLFISERTVENHVRSILNKLGFNSRAQIAAWVASGST
jgi:predicted ATPase/DNA-binding CsgD family transcriptional regulator